MQKSLNSSRTKKYIAKEIGSLIVEAGSFHGRDRFQMCIYYVSQRDDSFHGIIVVLMVNLLFIIGELTEEMCSGLAGKILVGE